MTDPVLRFQPLDGKALESVKLADRRLNVWEGSVRSAKTVSSIVAWVRFVRNAPPGELLMFAKTERTLKRNVIHPMQDMLGQRVRYVQGEGEVWVCGRRIYVAGANDERSQEKIRGLTLAGAYGDELSTVPESFFSMTLSRLSIKGAKLFGTTNPDNPRHYLLKDYLERACLTIGGDGTVTDRRDEAEGTSSDLLNLARFRFRIDDNRHLPESYVAGLKREFVGLWYRRFILGEWVAAEGSIFPMLDLDVDSPVSHVVSELPHIAHWWLAVDYATASIFHAALVGLGTDDRLYVAREWRWDAKRNRGQLTDPQYAEKLKAWIDSGADGAAPPGYLGVEKVYVDPSAASFIRQLWRDGWGGVTPANNDVMEGIREVSSLLGARRLLFHESCTGTLDEFTGYVWDSKATAIGEDKPLKQDDHAPDAVRYLVRMTRRWWRGWLDAGGG